MIGFVLGELGKGFVDTGHHSTGVVLSTFNGLTSGTAMVVVAGAHLVPKDFNDFRHSSTHLPGLLDGDAFEVLDS
jgi:hypothetical protein